jgi:GT2 family glycosyltransferase
MREVDIVIISDAKCEPLLKQTHRAIESLNDSEDPSIIHFNIFVVESTKSVNYDQYTNVKTIHTDLPFGYHRYLNLGRKAGNAEYVVLCNNDLTFGKNWASIAIEAMEKRQVWSAGCCNPNKKTHKAHIDKGLKTVDGWGVSNHITGWCIFQKREIYEHIGDLDEDFEFWYCDNDYSKTLQKLGFYNMLILDSIVYHHDGTLGSTTKRETDQARKEELTHGARKVFDAKWSRKKA